RWRKTSCRSLPGRKSLMTKTLLKRTPGQNVRASRALKPRTITTKSQWICMKRVRKTRSLRREFVLDAASPSRSLENPQRRLLPTSFPKSVTANSSWTLPQARALSGK
ncbi:hypothetical protein BaRGS_00038911, partial [Batillaria attramentaria]